MRAWYDKTTVKENKTYKHVYTFLKKKTRVSAETNSRIYNVYCIHNNFVEQFISPRLPEMTAYYYYYFVTLTTTEYNIYIYMHERKEYILSGDNNARVRPKRLFMRDRNLMAIYSCSRPPSTRVALCPQSNCFSCIYSL